MCSSAQLRQMHRVMLPPICRRHATLALCNKKAGQTCPAVYVLQTERVLVAYNHFPHLFSGSRTLISSSAFLASSWVGGSLSCPGRHGACLGVFPWGVGGGALAPGGTNSNVEPPQDESEAFDEVSLPSSESPVLPPISPIRTSPP
jgi:hypothetical protein